jgi:hypothetical protein
MDSDGNIPLYLHTPSEDYDVGFIDKNGYVWLMKEHPSFTDYYSVSSHKDLHFSKDSISMGWFADAYPSNIKFDYNYIFDQIKK